MKRFESFLAYVLHYSIVGFVGVTAIFLFKFFSTGGILLDLGEIGDDIALISYILFLILMPIALGTYFFSRKKDFSKNDQFILKRFFTKELLKDLSYLFIIMPVAFIAYIATILGEQLNEIDAIFFILFVGIGVALYVIQDRKLKNGY